MLAQAGDVKCWALASCQHWPARASRIEPPRRRIAAFLGVFALNSAPLKILAHGCRQYRASISRATAEESWRNTGDATEKNGYAAHQARGDLVCVSFSLRHARRHHLPPRRGKPLVIGERAPLKIAGSLWRRNLTRAELGGIFVNPPQGARCCQTGCATPSISHRFRSRSRIAGI